MNRIRNHHLLLVGVMVVAAGFVHRLSIAADAVSTPVPLPISCNLNCHQENQRILVAATFSNVTDSACYVFNGALLKEKDTEGVCFRVNLNRERLPYSGIYVKRPSPGIDEFYSMKPHEVVVQKIEISKYFDFSKPGEYEIAYSCIANGWPPGGTNLLRILSNSVKFTKREAINRR